MDSEQKIGVINRGALDFVRGADRTITTVRNVEVALGNIFRMVVDNSRIQGALLCLTLVGGFVNIMLAARRRHREQSRGQLSYLWEQSKRYDETEAATKSRLKTEKIREKEYNKLIRDIYLHEIMLANKRKQMSAIRKKDDDAADNDPLYPRLESKILKLENSIRRNKARKLEIENLIAQERQTVIDKINAIKTLNLYHNPTHNEVAKTAVITSETHNFKMDFHHNPPSKKMHSFVRKYFNSLMLFSTMSGTLLGLCYLGANLFNAVHIFSPFVVGTGLLTMTTIATSALTFGIPIVVALGLTALHLYLTRNDSDVKVDQTHSKVNHHLTRIVGCEMFFDALDKKLGIHSAIAHRPPEFQENDQQPVDLDKMPAAIQSLRSDKTKRLFKGFRSVSAFINHSAVMKTALFVLSLALMKLIPPIVPVVIIVGSVVALGYAAYKVVKKYRKATLKLEDLNNRIKEKESTLLELHALELSNQSKRDELFSKSERCVQHDSQRNITQFTGGFPRQGISNNNDFWRKLTPVKTNVIKTIGSSIAEFFSKAFTLSFITRSALIPEVSAAATSAITVTSIGVWGPFKLAEYFFNKNYKRDIAYLEEAEGRLYAARREQAFLTESLKKVDVVLEADGQIASVEPEPPFIAKKSRFLSFFGRKAKQDDTQPLLSDEESLSARSQLNV